MATGGEEWRSCLGVEVSNLGRVIDRKSGLPFVPLSLNAGWVCVGVCLRIAWAYDDDDPGGRHGEPAKDVRDHARDHAPRKVLPALRLHKVVRLGADDGVGGLDVVEWPVETHVECPLVLGDELERARVVAVPRNGRGQRPAHAPEVKLVGAHGPVVRRGVHERLGRRDVFN